MKHLVLVGACYLDTILSVPHFPEEDAKLRATNLETRRGGNCPNSLDVLQQLVRDGDDVCMHLISCLPNKTSAAAQRVVESFGTDTNIDFEHCIYRNEESEAASSYIFRNLQTGSRTIVNYNGLPEMTIDEFASIVPHFNPDEESWWHFEGRIPPTTLECMRLLRQTLPRAKISVEVEKPGREGLLKLAAEADVVFYSRTWAETRGHKTAESCLRNEARGRASLSLCPWGAGGASALSHETDSYFDCPVKQEPKDVTVVDAVGAGDTFIAGMLYGLICRNTKWDIQRCLRFAVNLATLKVQREGFRGLGNDTTTMRTEEEAP
ncbi:hypothetical protein K4F52_004233 [Lecanicillium sp. MT-2017a]|nr:hypothetical protein K4F52_004233 [Lecanicillium sp. MT-2017a]